MPRPVILLLIAVAAVIRLRSDRRHSPHRRRLSQHRPVPHVGGSRGTCDASPRRPVPAARHQLLDDVRALAGGRDSFPGFITLASLLLHILECVAGFRSGCDVGAHAGRRALGSLFLRDPRRPSGGGDVVQRHQRTADVLFRAGVSVVLAAPARSSERGAVRARAALERVRGGVYCLCFC